ncbi:hypothetical protein [uncultured Aquimarina sp.]|uniref:hypothetical protein n=1 Tax=uncultured Aquimarina sp. TaxID=575652 RepID=UPI0026192D11|nr:hypothetical protein [uncultured Aquimarina sp.]
MRKYQLFVNYRLLWREIQDSNKFKILHTRSLRRGNSYVLYDLCNRYKDLLNKIIKEHKTIDPDNLPTLYVGSSDMYRRSPYQMKSITDCLQVLTDSSYRHIISIKSIFNNSKFKVRIPLRYFFTLDTMGYQEHLDEMNNPNTFRRF